MKTQKVPLPGHENSPSSTPYVYSIPDAQVPINDSVSQTSCEVSSSSPSINASSSVNAAYQFMNNNSGVVATLPDSGIPAQQSDFLPRSTDTSAVNFSNLPLHSLHSFVMDSSESYFGWEIGDTELDHLKTLNSHAPNTPPENWFPTDVTNSILHPSATLSYERNPGEASVSLPPATRDSQPADIPWVSLDTHQPIYN